MNDSQRERENFYRNSTVIVDIGKEVLSALLDKELTNQKLTLPGFINKNQHAIYHMCFNRKLCCFCVNRLLPSSVQLCRVLCEEQLDILFDKCAGKHPNHDIRSSSPYCCCFAISTVETRHLDITLLRVLLLNFTGICKNGQPVYRAVKDIGRLRNTLYGHVEQARMSNDNFEKYSPEIEKCILEIADICNIKPEIHQKLKDAYKRPLDTTVCLELQNLLLNEIRRQREIQEDIKHIESHVTDIHKQLQCQIRDSAKTHREEIKNCSDNIENKLVDIQRFYKEQGKDAKLFNEKMLEQFQTVQERLQDSEEVISMHVCEAKSCIQQEINDLKETQGHSIGNVDYMRGFAQEILAKHGSLQDTWLQNLIAQTEQRIRNHEKDTTFFPTHTMSEAMKCLEQHNTLIILGKEGSGKSTTAIHIATCLKEQDYEPILFLDQDIMQHRHVLSPRHKYLIIVEDLFGLKYEDDVHNKCLDLLQNLVSHNPTIKIVLTIINKRIDQNDIFRSHALFENAKIINLDSNGLSDKEKINILLYHMRRNSISKCNSPLDDGILFDWEEIPKCNVCSEEVQELSDGQLQLCTDTIYLICFINPNVGFPEMCRLFCHDPKNTLLGVNFFRRTSKTLANQLQDLYAAGVQNVRFRYQYCLLVYMALSNGCLYFETVENNFKDDSLFQELLSVFENAPSRMQKTLVKNALRDLEGHLLIKSSDFQEYHCDFEFQCVENTYMLKDPLIEEAVLFSYGTEFPEEFLKLSVCDIKFIMSYIRPLENPSVIMKEENMIFVPVELLNDKLYRILRFEKGMKYFLEHASICGLNVTAKRQKSQEEQMTSTDEYGFGEDIHSLIIQENLAEHRKLGIESEMDLKGKSVKDGGIFYRYQCSSSERVGAFLRQCLADRFSNNLIGEFFEKLDIFSISPQQITDILNGLTRRGTCTQILSVKTDKIINIVFKYGGVKLICKLCRPKSNIQSSGNFYQVEPTKIYNLIMNAMHRNAGYQIVKEIGHYLYTISLDDGSITFVEDILKAIFEDYTKKNIGCRKNILYLFDGLFDNGRNPSAIVRVKQWFPAKLGDVCSINLILCLCQERGDFILFDHEDHVYFKTTKPEFIEFMVHRTFFHLFLHNDLKSGIDFSIQTKILGNDLYKFVLKIKDLKFVEDLLLSIVNICNDMSISLAHDDEMNKHFLALLIKGFTNDNARSAELQELYPQSLGRMLKHIKRYDEYMETGKDTEENLREPCVAETVFRMLGFDDDVNNGS